MFSLTYLFTRFSAFLKHKEDYFRLGEYYYLGKYVKKNDKKARYWLEKASDSGEKRALYYLGLMEQEKSEPNLLMALRYLELSRRSEPRAIDAITPLLAHLKSLPIRDDNRQELAELYFKIAYMYGNDNHIERNYEEAKNFYRASVNLDYAPAKAQLGQLYLYGRLGVERTYEVGKELLFDALNSGYAPAREILLNFYQKEEIRALLEKEAESNSSALLLQNIIEQEKA